MIKRILVPVDPSTYSDVALEYALFIAKRQQAEVTGIAILDINEIEHSTGLILPGGESLDSELEEFWMKEAGEKIDILFRRFEARCKSENINHRTIREEGNPADRILDHSIYYDVVIMGLRSHFHFETSDEPGDTFEKVLNNSVTPVLAVPEHFSPFRNILVAFDGSQPAARALRNFIHLALPMDMNIKIVTAGIREKEALQTLLHAQEYLLAYDLKNVNTEYYDGNILDAIDTKYLEWTDLFVIGAHSKSTFQSFFKGSVTKHLISLAQKPVFVLK